ncbi:hypothetical protein [Yoonia sp.]|uniref:hypothetical protein n=1 Tax=Yoonia sp. TaxID=2212373 RepID=UPI001A02B7A9|nr:hypothetical protein [Yoonia sp.]MBE0413749.1 hypothetical protein [Yoonia sp.]
MKTLGVMTIGRSGVDLYGTQIGGRPEDMGSLEKYIGGSVANILDMRAAQYVATLQEVTSHV